MNLVLYGAESVVNLVIRSPTIRLFRLMGAMAGLRNHASRHT